MSDSLQSYESQHARPPCPSPAPGVHPDPRPSSQWCHPAISSSVIPFSSCWWEILYIAPREWDLQRTAEFKKRRGLARVVTQQLFVGGMTECMCERMNEMGTTLKFRNRINRSWCAVVNLKFIPQHSPNLFLKFCICVPSTPLVAISYLAAKSDQPTVTISSKAKFLASPDATQFKHFVIHGYFLSSFVCCFCCSIVVC